MKKLSHQEIDELFATDLKDLARISDKLKDLVKELPPEILHHDLVPHPHTPAAGAGPFVMLTLVTINAISTIGASSLGNYYEAILSAMINVLLIVCAQHESTEWKLRNSVRSALKGMIGVYHCMETTTRIDNLMTAIDQAIPEEKAPEEAVAP
jgi:hypothetical protein